MNNKTILTLAAVFLVGLLGGYFIGQLSGSSSETTDYAHSHDDNHHTDAKSHSHDAFEVKKTEAPTVKMTVKKDAKSGWNIHVETTKFSFTPDKVNGDNIIGEGHAHLYVDNEKVARLYGPDFHYDADFEGAKTFKVTLNANDHREYSVDGESITASQSVTAHHEH